MSLGEVGENRRRGKYCDVPTGYSDSQKLHKAFNSAASLFPQLCVANSLFFLCGSCFLMYAFELFIDTDMAKRVDKSYIHLAFIYLDM